ncbi:MAG TPA: PIN domain-containing protein [Firmicutes bacterium]|nr:PIN domain-containing protein [Bacillota bacterium]HHY98531.1 PIN domain-containing protein [Bacillota bacterium]
MKIRVFLDASILFAAVWSETGGARLILKLGEAGAIELWTGPWTLRETDAVLDRKSPKSKSYFALLLDRARIQVGPEASRGDMEKAESVVDYAPDARVLAEALTAGADYFVSFDRKHLIGNPRTGQLPFRLGTAGDFIEWYRGQLQL